MSYRTEEEAAKTWCPEYQVATSGGEPSTYEMDNRPEDCEQDAEGKWQPNGKILPHACCIGSRCMAWRWATSNKQPQGTGFWGNGTPVRGGLGYCGKAGRPET